MFIEKILVATDGSDLAVRAAQVAALLAGTGGRHIVAFSVAQPRFSLPAEGDVIGMARMWRRIFQPRGRLQDFTTAWQTSVRPLFQAEPAIL